jgi:hypothetical protein
MPSNAVSARNSTTVHPHCLSNVQMELIKLYSINLNEHELLELKNILAHHFSQKAINEADNVWQENGMSAQTMNESLIDL